MKTRFDELLFLLALTLVTAPDVARADGAMVRGKVPTGQVLAPPVAVEKEVDVDLVLAPEHMQPGTHTLTLDIAQSRPVRAVKLFSGPSGRCYEGDPIGPPLPAPVVGWGEHEPYQKDPCSADVMQLAVLFDRGDLEHIPAKTIDRVTLTYDEAEAPDCWLADVPVKGCWRNGQGLPEQKPDGCVVVRVPTVAWHESPPPGLIPFSTGKPEVRRLGTMEWDVTEPYTWQNVQGAVPLGVNPGFGFLLTGSITSLDQLEGEDSTQCFSMVPNIKLHVTYTVPPPQPPPDVIR